MKTQFRILFTILALGASRLCAEEVAQANTLGSSTFTFEVLRTAFLASPIIYSVLIFLSTCSLSLCIYSLFLTRRKPMFPRNKIFQLKEMISQNMFNESAIFCSQNDTIFFKVIKCALDHKQYGLQGMKEVLYTEGKRLTASYWHRLSLINEIAVIAPMIGLLGTVVGLFQGFYHLDRSLANMLSLFDGLGISVGTTVVGLIVAIASMVSYSIARFKLMQLTTEIENEALEVIYLIDYSIQPIEAPYVLNT